MGYGCMERIRAKFVTCHEPSPEVTLVHCQTFELYMDPQKLIIEKARREDIDFELLLWQGIF